MWILGLTELTSKNNPKVFWRLNFLFLLVGSKRHSCHPRASWGTVNDRLSVAAFI